MKNSLSGVNPAIPVDPDSIPVKAGPVSSSTIEPMDNGHMVTTNFEAKPPHPYKRPEPKVKVFEKGTGGSDHLLRAVNHIYKMHGGKGTLAVDTDHDNH